MIDSSRSLGLRRDEFVPEILDKHPQLCLLITRQGSNISTGTVTINYGFYMILHDFTIFFCRLPGDHRCTGLMVEETGGSVAPQWVPEGPKAQGPEPSKSTVLSVRPVNIALGPLPDVEASGNPFCFLGIVVVHIFSWVFLTFLSCPSI